MFRIRHAGLVVCVVLLGVLLPYHVANGRSNPSRGYRGSSGDRMIITTTTPTGKRNLGGRARGSRSRSNSIRNLQLEEYTYPPGCRSMKCRDKYDALLAEEGEEEEEDDEDEDEDEDEDDQGEDQDDEDEEDNEDGAAQDAQEKDPSDTPTIASTIAPTIAPTMAPTIAPTKSPTVAPVVVVSAVEATPQPTETPAPIFIPAPTPNPTNVLPVVVATPLPATPNPTTLALVAATPMPTTPTDITITLTEKPTDPLPEDETVSVIPPGDPSNETALPQPYAVPLDPLYMYMTMEGDTSEAGFLEVLVDYMEYYMSKDFQGFQSITYGATLFSMITKYPTISRQSGQQPSEEAGGGVMTASTSSLLTPTSNVTVHIHLLTSNFEGQPNEPDSVIKEYMAMLLEDEERMQDYINSQQQPGSTGLSSDSTIVSVTVEFEETVNPTDVVGEDGSSTPNGASGGLEEEGEERTDNTMTIVFWTVGSFVILLWVVFLYGIQSRDTS